MLEIENHADRPRGTAADQSELFHDGWSARIKASKLRYRVSVYVYLPGPILLLMAYFSLFPLSDMRTISSVLNLFMVLSVAGAFAAIINLGVRWTDVRDLLKCQSIEALPEILTYIVLVSIQKGGGIRARARLRDHLFHLPRDNDPISAPELHFEQQRTLIGLHRDATPEEMGLLFRWVAALCGASCMPMLRRIIDRPAVFSVILGSHASRHAAHCLAEIAERESRATPQRTYLRPSRAESGDLLLPAAGPRTPGHDEMDLMRPTPTGPTTAPDTRTPDPGTAYPER